MTEQNDKRAAAIKRLRAKRGFKIHAAIYLVVNALIVVVWASSGAGYFWPIWAMLGWGIGFSMAGAFTCRSGSRKTRSAGKWRETASQRRTRQCRKQYGASNEAGEREIADGTISARRSA
jgi:2TM domain